MAQLQETRRFLWPAMIQMALPMTLTLIRIPTRIWRRWSVLLWLFAFFELAG